MNKTLILIYLLTFGTIVQAANVNVTIETNYGDTELELFPDLAPITVENFLGYANTDFYDGLIFHRVIEDFIIQAGSYDQYLNYYPAGPPIINESYNGLSNLRGTIAMARTALPDSATSQFYINHVDNTFLDQGPGSEGYCVFGQVTNGMDVVDAIAATPTSIHDVPIDPVIIYNITPEPTTIAMLAIGSGLAAIKRRKI